MILLEAVCRKIADLFKQGWGFPRFIAIAFQRRRRQFALNALEAERLDRIRNPSKYLGK
jgi:hypothetical protein